MARPWRSSAPTPSSLRAPPSWPPSARPRDLVPLEFPAEALVEPQPVVITAADGMKIRCQLFASPAAANEKRPAVLFFHGGSRRQMLLGWHYLPYYHATYAMNQWLASKGLHRAVGQLSQRHRLRTGFPRSHEFRRHGRGGVSTM